jgi:stress response protein YsnF
VSWLSRLEVGMQVYATDGLLGSVASVPRVDLGDPSAPAEVIVLASQDNAGPGVEEFRRVSREMIERVEATAVYLNESRASVPAASAAVSAAHRRLHEGEQQLNIPIVEEQVEVDTRIVELGHVTVQKKVDEFLDERSVSLRHQQVEIERVPVDRIIDEIIEPYLDGDVYVVPIIEEEIVVTRRLRLKEELRVQRTIGHHEESLQTPFRRERVVVTEHWYDDDRPAVNAAGPDADATVAQPRQTPADA